MTDNVMDFYNTKRRHTLVYWIVRDLTLSFNLNMALELSHYESCEPD